MLRRQDCLVFKHVFCVNIGGIYWILWGTSRVLGCRYVGDRDRVLAENVLDVKHKDWPARYVGSQNRDEGGASTFKL